MKVHFSASLQDIDDYIETYVLIEDAIKNAGHEIAREWLKDYRVKGASSEYFTEAQWKKIADDTLVAVEAADAIIVEATIPSFSLGYISALALANKKPLLVLFNDKPQPYYILDANNSLKRAEVYRNDDELLRAVNSFLSDNDVDANNLRFNMTLDRETYNFLNWESVNTGKTKARIVREILKDRINRKD